MWYEFILPRDGIQFPMAERIAREMETSMRTNEDIMAEAQALRDKAEQLERITEERDKYGEDPFKNGTILKVEMRYRTGSRRSFAYAVIKVAGRFYLSGKMGGTSHDQVGYSWENFVAWLAQGDATVWRAKQLEQVL
jgi:hypothetical protein